MLVRLELRSIPVATLAPSHRHHRRRRIGHTIHHRWNAAQIGKHCFEITIGELAEASQAVAVRHFAENDSMFLDDAYLIKGIAGSILWILLSDYVQSGRKEFTNCGLRLDPRLRFPDINDNLEARLILLQKRLVDRDAPIQLEKTGRGRFALNVSAKLELHEVAGSGRR